MSEDFFEGFDAQLAYEALRESLNIEIARHNRLAHLTDVADEVARHRAAVSSLVRARGQISPNTPDALEVGLLILASFTGVDLPDRTRVA